MGKLFDIPIFFMRVLVKNPGHTRYQIDRTGKLYKNKYRYLVYLPLILEKKYVKI